MRTQDAKRILISELLAALGHAPVKELRGEKWYFSPFRDEQTASFKLSADQRAFYDHGRGQGGNILDFAMLYFDASLPDALREIERLVGSPARRAAALGQYSLLERDSPAAGATPAPMPEPSVTPLEAQSRRADAFTDVTIKAVSDGRLLRYLHERAIPPALAREYLHEIRYTYHEKRYFALAFQNDNGSYETRNQYFQGVFGKKAISTLHLSQTGPAASVAVFEGVFDFLSALVWDRAALDGAVIVMNSVAMKAQTLAQIRQIGAPQVLLYLDNDRAGKTLTLELQQELTGVKVVDGSGVYEACKDFNEFLQAQQRQHSAKKGGILA